MVDGASALKAQIAHDERTAMGMLLLNDARRIQKGVRQFRCGKVTVGIRALWIQLKTGRLFGKRNTAHKRASTRSTKRGGGIGVKANRFLSDRDTGQLFATFSRRGRLACLLNFGRRRDPRIGRRLLLDRSTRNQDQEQDAQGTRKQEVSPYF